MRKWIKAISNDVAHLQREVTKLRGRVRVLECEGHEWEENHEAGDWFSIAIVPVVCKKCGLKSTFVIRKWNEYQLAKAKKDVEWFSALLGRGIGNHG